MTRLLRFTNTATFLYLGAVLVLFALSEAAHPQEAAVKGDIHAAVPLPQTKPVQCRLPIAALADLVGWRILNGSKAAAYLSTAFKTHPPADAMAFATIGDKTAMALAKDGCIIINLVIPTKVHGAVMDKALGIVA